MGSDLKPLRLTTGRKEKEKEVGFKREKGTESHCPKKKDRSICLNCIGYRHKEETKRGGLRQRKRGVGGGDDTEDCNRKKKSNLPKGARRYVNHGNG